MSYRYGIRQWFRWLRNWLPEAPARLAALFKKEPTKERLVDEIAALRNVCQRVKDHKDFDAAWAYHMGRLEDRDNEEEPS